MRALIRYGGGDFRAGELKRYVTVVSLGFWGLIFIAWLSYPKDHHYSIMTHTFSFLGSFEGKHNPRWWWIFSIAMTFWGCAAMPLAFYIHRRFAVFTKWGARVGTLFLLMGCTGIVLVAVFPDARGAVIGTWEWTEIHEKVAIIAAAGFILGNTWHGLLLVADAFSSRWTGVAPRPARRAILWPYLFWVTLTGIAAYFLITWEFLYAEMKAAAHASGAHIGSSWSEALNTRYSFPLWENITIYTLFIFLIWFTLALPRGEGDAAPDRNR
ncbi:MAG TPA: hypothetical protein PKI11_12140 [Candidatus Hydrogenedentes bacterium]|nr:hypothetical protein [Candidatus Hydrogenedentota bacterium]HNT88292.1 hypothetical protein [Candidatus Hydrogenedentota bacterium]